jgi:CheY-like chemotaxis protein
MRILFVEDDRESADAFAALADALGYETEVAYDGNGAMRLIDTHQFGAVFMDISLPDADGRDLCLHIRASSASRHACIFAVTGTADLSDEELAPFDGCLVKPLTVDALQNALKSTEE